MSENCDRQMGWKKNEDRLKDRFSGPGLVWTHHPCIHPNNQMNELPIFTPVQQAHGGEIFGEKGRTVVCPESCPIYSPAFLSCPPICILLVLLQ